MPGRVEARLDALVRFGAEVGDDDAPLGVGFGEQVLDKAETNAGAAALYTVSGCVDSSRADTRWEARVAQNESDGLGTKTRDVHTCHDRRLHIGRPVDGFLSSVWTRNGVEKGGFLFSDDSIASRLRPDKPLLGVLGYNENR